MNFNGKAFEETVGSTDEIPSVEVDLGIFVLGWESRHAQIVEAGLVTGRQGLILRFDDDELTQEEEDSFKTELKKHFSSVTSVNIGSALKREQWQSTLEQLFSHYGLEKDSLRCFVDYTCLPKAVTQTVYNMLLKRSVFPKTYWGYSEGLYSHTDQNIVFDQGVAGDFFQIEFARGKGGISSQRAAIIAMGADQNLLSYALEELDFDQVYMIVGNSAGSPDLDGETLRQKDRFAREFHIPEGNFRGCDASSVNSALQVYLSIVREIPKITDVQIFCSGPKTHAVAACAIAEKFHRSVGLLGRTPKKYTRHDVRPSGRVSFASVTNYCDPSIRTYLERYGDTF